MRNASAVNDAGITRRQVAATCRRACIVARYDFTSAFGRGSLGSLCPTILIAR